MSLTQVHSGEIDIKTIKQTIVERLMPLKPKKIILFGSFAYGSPTIESDIDLCIIDNSSYSKARKKAEIRQAIRDIKIPKDILVETEEYFMSHSDKNWINTALYDARHKGEVLYEQK